MVVYGDEGGNVVEIVIEKFDCYVFGIFVVVNIVEWVNDIFWFELICVSNIIICCCVVVEVVYVVGEYIVVCVV